jgi:hypothetical protein
MNAVVGEEAKAGKRAGNYGVCKGYFLKQLPTPQKSNYLSATIIRETNVLLNDATAYQSMANAINPYGDGTASEKIVEILAELKLT